MTDNYHNKIIDLTMIRMVVFRIKIYKNNKELNTD